MTIKNLYVFIGISALLISYILTMIRRGSTNPKFTYIFATNQNPFDKLLLDDRRERGLVR